MEKILKIEEYNNLRKYLYDYNIPSLKSEILINILEDNTSLQKLVDADKFKVIKERIINIKIKI